MVTLKTPGVYVEEITKFPPSVAPVATAIPAFIGYTEKATKALDGDLNRVPKRITSMLEYETYFGKGDDEKSIAVDVTEAGNIVVNNATPSSYKMYYSLQMYFANGGGPCYIVSVGSYGDSIELGTDTTGLTGGLKLIRKEDEPTLLVFPDSQALSASNFYAINQSALMQCNELQDRFTILDTHGDGETAIADLRAGISLSKDYLKYGAAYYPFLETILDYQYADADIAVTDSSFALPQTRIANIVGDGLLNLGTLDMTGFLVGLDAFDTAKSNFSPGSSLGLKPSLISKSNKLLNGITRFKTELEKIVAIGQEVVVAEPNEANKQAVVDAAAALDQWILDNLDSLIPALQNKIDKLVNDNTTGKVINTLASIAGASILNIVTGPLSDISTALTTELDPAGKVTDVSTTFTTLNGGTPLATALSAYEIADNALYNRIKAAISDYPVTLPPSSAMAGIYARVDNAFGVWKAPANVGVSYIQKPTVQISNEDQELMNVTTSGKSVNAIRTFNGKGTLVWGARTLAGNDNEWRYISVRRFFSFVEESVSEASEQFVFEPNTANTWVRLRSMVENFLLQQWKAGALAGAKPEEAFYVRIGLGQTMTAQDILEGRMIVEIGMAAVRPAEFIVLRFSHKMQES